MITIKSQKEIKTLKEGGKILAGVLRRLILECRSGISAQKLDQLAVELILKAGGVSSFKNYKPAPEQKPFPANICVSVNNVVVHGVPIANLILKSGDVVSLDLGLKYKKLFTDTAATIGIGQMNPGARKLIEVAKRSLDEGLKMARPGKTTGDIGYAIQNYVEKRGFSIIRALVGHGVGYGVHEDPYVPNYGTPGYGVKLEPGMVLAIEPMISAGTEEVIELPDGSFATRDGFLAAHFEHTIVISRQGRPIVLTK